MEQEYVDLVCRAILERRRPTILEIDEVPPYMGPGSRIRCEDTGEVMVVRDVDRETNEIAVDRFPRG